MQLIFIRAKTIKLPLSGVTLPAWKMVEKPRAASTSCAVDKYEFYHLFFNVKTKRAQLCERWLLGLGNLKSLLTGRQVLDLTVLCERKIASP